MDFSKKTKTKYCENDSWIYSYIFLPVQSVITTKVVSSSPTHGEVYSIQHYVLKFVSDFWQVSCILRVLRLQS
jgi:hypothetical protein